MREIPAKQATMPHDPPKIAVYPNRGGLISSMSPSDVLAFGRGQRVHTNAGNVKFYKIVEEYVEEYFHPTTKRSEKAHVVARLVAEVRRAGGRFLEETKDKRGYVEIGDEKAWKSE